METKFLRYTARDRKTKEILFKSRMDDENVLYLRKNESYNILNDKVVFFFLVDVAIWHLLLTKEILKKFEIIYKKG